VTKTQTVLEKITGTLNQGVGSALTGIGSKGLASLGPLEGMFTKIGVAAGARVGTGMCVTFRFGFCARNRFAVFLGGGPP
jgi:hypothetical protein